MSEFDDVVLPPGLRLCEVCGIARGVALLARADGSLYTAPSSCRCDGIRCRRCGQGMVMHPCTDYYSWQRRTWIHVPHFNDRAWCEYCREEQQAKQEAALTSDPPRRLRLRRHGRRTP